MCGIAKGARACTAGMDRPARIGPLATADVAARRYALHARKRGPERQSVQGWRGPIGASCCRSPAFPASISPPCPQALPVPRTLFGVRAARDDGTPAALSGSALRLEGLAQTGRPAPGTPGAVAGGRGHDATSARPPPPCGSGRQAACSGPPGSWRTGLGPGQDEHSMPARYRCAPDRVPCRSSRCKPGRKSVPPGR